MVTRNEEISRQIDLAEHSILNAVRGSGGSAMAPREAIRIAVRDGAKESIARSAIWFLLDRDAIIMTDDRKLAVVAKP